MRNCGADFLFTFGLSIAAMVACGTPRAEPLYPPTPHPLRPEQVSTLSGFVQFVDDKDVSSLGSNFELLPGCHVIRTPARWGDQSSAGNAVITANTGHWAFALPMRAGYQYWIKVNVGEVTAPMGRLTIKGYESDLAGNQTREFGHVTSAQGIESCHEEARNFRAGKGSPTP